MNDFLWVLDVEVVKLTGRPEPGQKQRKPLPPELADDPRFYVPPKGEEKKNYRETPAFLYNRNCRFIEGTFSSHFILNKWNDSIFCECILKLQQSLQLLQVYTGKLLYIFFLKHRITVSFKNIYRHVLKKPWNSSSKQQAKKQLFDSFSS